MYIPAYSGIDKYGLYICIRKVYHDSILIKCSLLFAWANLRSIFYKLFTQTTDHPITANVSQLFSKRIWNTICKADGNWKDYYFMARSLLVRYHYMSRNYTVVQFSFNGPWLINIRIMCKSRTGVQGSFNEQRPEIVHNEIVDHWDVVGASLVGAAPIHDLTLGLNRLDKNNGIWCVLY